VTGITISGRQVEIAKKLTQAETSDETSTSNNSISPEVNTYSSGGDCRFIELDAEKMLEYFSVDGKPAAQFDAVWISEALSHFPDKPLFFRSAAELLVPDKSSCLVIADWFKAPQLSPEQERDDIQIIEDGMLLPPLCTADQYVEMAQNAGLKVHHAPIDISNEVAKTWCVYLPFIDVWLSTPLANDK
jgi:tocopherol O-methyltransferase